MSSTQWGIEPYGQGIYGGVTDVGVTVSGAIAISTNQVQVTLTGEVVSSSASAANDALNPASWMVQRIDVPQTFSVLSVTAISSTVFVLAVYEPWGPVTSLHRVTAFGLEDPSGEPIGSPNSADFYGLLSLSTATESARAARRAATVRDLANPQAPSTALEHWGGTLRISSSGDYTLVGGAELVKKLILRRLLTKKGEFFHLPDYGAGLAQKELVTSAQIVRERTNIENQVKLEREVDNVSVGLTMAATGQVTARVRARLKSTGETIDMAMTVQGYVAF